MSDIEGPVNQCIDEHLRSQINIDVLTILLMSILRLSIKLTIKQCNLL